MPLLNLKEIFDNYLFTSDSFELGSILNSLAEEIFRNGLDPEGINHFSKEFSIEKKKSLINDLFQEAITTSQEKKLKIINTLGVFLTETSLEIREEILPVFFKNLTNKTDFKIVFTTINIFTMQWNSFNDDLKKEIYLNLIEILNNPFELFIEEGVFEITKLVVNSKSSIDSTKDLFTEQEIIEYLDRLIRISIKGKGNAIYAALESIKQIFEVHKALLTELFFTKIFQLSKRFQKKIAIFYPSKRIFIKAGVSFVSLILMFENVEYDIDYIKNLSAVINKLVDKIDHADVKYLLELLVQISGKPEHYPKIEIIRPSLKIIKSLHQKKSRMEDYINDLIAELINALWPLLKEKEKDMFYQENEYGISNV